MGKGLLCLIGAAFLSRTFYASWWGMFLFVPAAFLVWKRWEKGGQDSRVRSDREEFHELLEGFLTALEAGLGPENALSQAAASRRRLIGTEASGTVLALWEEACRRCGQGRPFAEAFTDLTRRLSFPEGARLAQALAIIEEQGGRRREILRDYLREEKEAERLRQQQRAMLSGKRMEAMIMKAVPIVLLWFLRLGAGDFLAPLYEGVAGRLFMTGCLALFGGGILWENSVFSALC